MVSASMESWGVSFSTLKGFVFCDFRMRDPVRINSTAWHVLAIPATELFAGDAVLIPIQL